MARPKDDDNLIEKTKKQQQPNINSIPNIYDMYRKRQELASEEYAEQRRLAEQQANIAREALAKQIEKQRYDYLRGQQAALDSSYDRGRRLTNALANRGLLTSGMLQLGDVQNRMATGQTLSSLAEANRDVTEAALQAEQAISRGLIDAINRAGLDYQRGLLESDRIAFEQDQALKAQQMDYALALLDALRDENLDQATRDALLSIMSPYLGGTQSGDTQSGEGGSLLDIIKGVVPSTAGEVGDVKFKDKFNWALSPVEILDRPQRALFGAIHALQKGEDVGEAIVAGLTKKDGTAVTFKDILHEAGMKDSGESFGLDDIVGFAGDIFLDPMFLPTSGWAPVIRRLLSPVHDTLGKYVWGIGKNYPVYFNIPGVGKQKFDNMDEALVVINKFYSDKPHSDKIKAVAHKNFLGARTGEVRFEVDGKQFKTYNQALNYYLNVASKK